MERESFFSKDSFTAKVDRPLGFITSNISALLRTY
jgi:hypothetical protein